MRRTIENAVCTCCGAVFDKKRPEQHICSISCRPARVYTPEVTRYIIDNIKTTSIQDMAAHIGVNPKSLNRQISYMRAAGKPVPYKHILPIGHVRMAMIRGCKYSVTKTERGWIRKLIQGKKKKKKKAPPPLKKEPRKTAYSGNKKQERRYPTAIGRPLNDPDYQMVLIAKGTWKQVKRETINSL